MRRETLAGVVLGARHRLSLDEALFAHTVDAAFAIGMDDRVGTLEPGKAADLTIVTDDLRRLGADEIEHVPIGRTIIGGETLFERRDG
jgi:predicted amidohydrolase YtcJ